MNQGKVVEGDVWMFLNSLQSFVLKYAHVLENIRFMKAYHYSNKNWTILKENYKRI